MSPLHSIGDGVCAQQFHFLSSINTTTLMMDPSESSHALKLLENSLFESFDRTKKWIVCELVEIVATCAAHCVKPKL